MECDLGDEYCSNLDGDFFELFDSPIRTSNKHTANGFVDGLDNFSQKVYVVIDFYNFQIILICLVPFIITSFITLHRMVGLKWTNCLMKIYLR